MDRFGHRPLMPRRQGSRKPQLCSWNRDWNQDLPPMRRLMLLRHAKSDWTVPGARDHDRTLNARGREAAPKMGAYMARPCASAGPDRRLHGDTRPPRHSICAAAFEAPPKGVAVRASRRRRRCACSASSRKRRAPRTACCWSATIPASASLPRSLIALGDVEARQRLDREVTDRRARRVSICGRRLDQAHPRGGRSTVQWCRESAGGTD